MSSPSWILARRYFFSGKGSRFVNWVSTASILGITVGVIALLITIAILNGFEQEVIQRVTRFIPHLTLTAAASDNLPVLDDPRIVKAYRYLERKAVIDDGSSQHVAQFQAPDLSAWRLDVGDNPQDFLGSGRLSPGHEEELPGIILGSGLADRMYVSIGDTLRVESPLDMQRGSMLVPQRHFIVTGIFHSELFDYDRRIAIIPFAEGKRLFQRGAPEETHLILNDYRDAPLVAEDLAAESPGLVVKTWHDLHRTLFDAMQLEKWGSFIGLNLIILVAVFNIVSTLIMMVLNKTSEIGILRVMGLNARQVSEIFRLQGFLVAIIGVFLGTAVGLTVYLTQVTWWWIRLPAAIYVIPALPMKLHIWEVLLIGGTALLIILLAVRYPARRAAELLPIQAIQYKK